MLLRTYMCGSCPQQNDTPVVGSKRDDFCAVCAEAFCIGIDEALAKLAVHTETNINASVLHTKLDNVRLCGGEKLSLLEWRELSPNLRDQVWEHKVDRNLPATLHAEVLAKLRHRKLW